MDQRAGSRVWLVSIRTDHAGRSLAVGEVQEAIAQGIGFALMEEYVSGATTNPHDYLVPTSGDVPKITTLFVAEPDIHGPYGATSLCERVLVGTAPAILNAIRRATGAAVRNLPATPVPGAGCHKIESGQVTI